MRIYDLAKEYGKSSSELLAVLKAHQIDKKASSGVSEGDRNIIEQAWGKPSAGQRTATASKAAHTTSDTKTVTPAARQEKRHRRPRPARTVRFDQQSGKPKEEYLIDGKGRRIEKPQPPAKQARAQEPRRQDAPHDAHKQDTRKQDARKQDTHKQDAHKQDAHKQDAHKQDARKQDAHKQDAHKQDAHKQDARKQDAHKQDTRKQDAHKQNTHKQDTRKQDAHKQDARRDAEKPARTNPKRERANTAAPASESSRQGGDNRRNERRDRNRRGKNRRAQDDRRKQGKSSSLLAQSIRKAKRPAKNRQAERTPAELPTEVALPPSVTVKELAELFGREVSDIIKRLMMLGIMATINQEVDRDAIEYLADDYGITLTDMEPEEDETEVEEIIDDPKDLLPRPAVVTIMGHVDHGKTSLLDTIRKTNVTAREAGGITQHIGAYQIRYQGNKIVFLDTPGHEAFTAMRARGAQVTDIAILVVAADDGVMPQTIEAINHAKAAGVPILVAINKMDKPSANPDHVKQQLAEHGLLPEEWGGDVIMVPVSAKQGDGISDLLDNILLIAEVLELKANPNRAAVGVVVEGELDKGRGPVVTVLVQNGTMHNGDGLLAGTAFGRVRAMQNEKGEQLKKAEPSTPVEILGLSEVPEAGEIIYAMDERRARTIAEKRLAKHKVEEQNRKQKVTLDDLFNQIKEGELKNLHIIIKADVQGSVEALRQSLESITHDEVRIDIVHAAVGAITESDIMLAAAVNALIIGFNVRPDSHIRKIAEAEQVDMRTYRVIYDAIDDVKMAMQGMLAPKFRELVLGRAEVRQVIPTPKVIVAGSYVTEGKMTNSAQLRLIRDGIVIHEGQIASLRRFKDDVREVAEGYECGISIESYRDVKEGDIIEAFTEEEIEQTLE